MQHKSVDITRLCSLKVVQVFAFIRKSCVEAFRLWWTRFNLSIVQKRLKWLLILLLSKNLRSLSLSLLKICYHFVTDFSVFRCFFFIELWTRHRFTVSASRVFLNPCLQKCAARLVCASFMKFLFFHLLSGQLVVCTLCSCVMQTKRIWLFSAHLLPLVARLCLVPLETIVFINKFSMIFTGLEVMYFLASNLLVPYNLAKTAYRELAQVINQWCGLMLQAVLMAVFQL